MSNLYNFKFTINDKLTPVGINIPKILKENNVRRKIYSLKQVIKNFAEPLPDYER